MKKNREFFTKIHLIISVMIVVPAAVLYAFFPNWQFDLFPKTMNEYSFYKSIMGLYLGFSVVWILGVFKASMLKTALVTNIVFMLGLGFGRLLSVVIDGTPAFVYTFGMIAEMGLGCYGIWVIKTFKIQ